MRFEGESGVGIRKLRVGIVLLVWGVMAGCHPDLDLVGEGDPVPVVYAVLDAADSLHSVKVTRSISGEAPVNDLIGEKDVYYENLEIQLHDADQGIRASFFPVDIPGKEPGLFRVSPNRIFQYPGVLPDGDYTLRIAGPALPSDLNAAISLFSDMELLYPASASKRIYLYDDPVRFTFTAANKAMSYELALILEFAESRLSGDSIRSVTYVRSVRQGELEHHGNQLTFRLYSDPFYAHLGRKLSDTTGVAYRRPRSLTLRLTAADAELDRYISQLNGDSPIATSYTGNVENGIGIVAAKYSVTRSNRQLSPKAQDSLRFGRFTRNLRFIANSDW